MVRDFDWYQNNLWAIIKKDGSFAGRPCVTFEEARELANQHEGSHVYYLCIDYDDDSKRYPEPYDDRFDDVFDDGFDPYMGEYTYDC